VARRRPDLIGFLIEAARGEIAATPEAESRCRPMVVIVPFQIGNGVENHDKAHEIVFVVSVVGIGTQE